MYFDGACQPVQIGDYIGVMLPPNKQSIIDAAYGGANIYWAHHFTTSPVVGKQERFYDINSPVKLSVQLYVNTGKSHFPAFHI